MPLFLITFFIIYGGMHLYTFLKIQRAFAPPVLVRVCIAVFMTLMIFTPVVVRLSEKHGYAFFAQLLSYAGYFWLGIIFLFFVFALALDCFRLVVFTAESVLRKDFLFLKLSGPALFFIPLLISVLITIIGYFQAQNIRTEKITMQTSEIPGSLGSIRIVQISDVHTGLIVRTKRLQAIIKAVKNADPDILVSTGDLVDGQIDNLSELSDLFKEVNPKLGKFAVTGNHEFYAGLDQALNFTQKSGFTVLRGEGKTVGGVMNIAGVDDPAGKRYGLYRDVSAKELLARLPQDKFTLLLKHRPFIETEAIGLFDLQLSGHTHKGQIFPFNLVTKLYYPNHAGLMKIDDKTAFYVSRGSGTWGPPVRFLSPPEVTVIELVPE